MTTTLQHHRKLSWLVCLLAVIACGAAAYACMPGKPTLYVYTWAGYIKPEIIARFETRERARVVLDTFDSNEAMYAKLKAGAGGYDLLFPSSYMLNALRAQGMIRELNHNLLPNLVNIDPVYLPYTNDVEMRYGVPYMISSSGIGYLKSKVAGFDSSWSVFGSSQYAGRMTLLNDMRETIGMALKYLGHSVNTVDDGELAAARALLIKWKKNLAKFESEQYKNGLAAEEFLVVHGYSGDILQAQADNPDIAYLLPKEGTSVASDSMVIPTAARSDELAHRFINYLHAPEIAAENMEYVRYLCPNRAAYPLLSEETRNNPAIFLAEEVLAKSESIQDLGEANRKYTRVWDAVKAAE